MHFSCSLSALEFSETVLYLSDFAGSLCSFLEVYPPACYALEEVGFIGKAVAFYESAITKLQENWHQLKHELAE